MKKSNVVNKVSLYQDSYFWYALLPCLFLFGITFAVYFPSLNYPFQFDDTPNIVKFYDIRNKGFFDLFISCSRWISYWLNTLYFSFSRFEPWYYRLGNVLFHALTGIGVYHLVIRFYNYFGCGFFSMYAPILAYLTTGIFLLHPVQTQTVSYVIQGQLEGLAALTMVFALLSFFVMYEEKNKWLQCFKYLAMLLICFLASGTKEIVIVLPLLFLLVDWFFLARGSFSGIKSRWWVHVPVSLIIWGMYLYFLKPAFFKQVFGFSMVYYNNMGNVITPEPHTAITPLHFCMSQFKVILHYIWIYFWPFGISVDYDWILVKHWWSWDCLAPFMALCALGYYLLVRLKQNALDYVSFLALWFFILVLPRSSIIPSTELLMDYKAYTASIALCMLLAIGLVYLMVYLRATIVIKLESSSRMMPISPVFAQGGLLAEYGVVHPSYAAASVFLLLLGLTTIERNKVWRSSEEFWLNIIHNAPKKARAYNNYGVALAEKGKFADAILYYKQAIKMDDRYVDPRNNLAVALGAVGEINSAIDVMREVIALQPWYPEGYNNLASLLLLNRKHDEAYSLLMTALDLRPYYGKAHYNIGRIFWDQGQYEKAYRSFKKCCLEADFDNEAGYQAYALAAMKLGKYEEAIEIFDKTLSFNPYSPDHRFNRANCFYYLKEFNKSLATYQELVREYPNEARYWFNLGEAYAMLGQPALALEAYKQAMRFKTFIGGVGLRIAYCLDQIDKRREAYIFLQEYIKRGPPIDQQMSARAMLKQLMVN